MAAPESAPDSNRPEHVSFDVAIVHRVLGVEPTPQDHPPHTFVLRNDDQRLSVHLTMDPLERSLSLYLRGDNGFLGFLHLGSVDHLEVDEAKQQVAFVIKHGDGETLLKVEHGGVFALTQRRSSEQPAKGGPTHA